MWDTKEVLRQVIKPSEEPTERVRKTEGQTRRQEQRRQTETGVGLGVGVGQEQKQRAEGGQALAAFLEETLFL